MGSPSLVVAVLTTAVPPLPLDRKVVGGKRGGGPLATLSLAPSTTSEGGSIDDATAETERGGGWTGMVAAVTVVV